MAKAYLFPPTLSRNNTASSEVARGGCSIAENPDRRSFMKVSAGATGGAMAAMLPLAIDAHASQEEDAELKRLWHQWRESHENALQADFAADDAQFEAKQKYPEPPDIITSRNGSTDKRRLMSREEIRQGYEGRLFIAKQGSRAEKRNMRWRDQAFEAYDAWEAECRAVDEAHRVPELKNRSRDADEQICIFEKAIVNTPAESVLGLAIKLHLYWAFIIDPTDPDGSKAELDGGQRSVVAAFEDAVCLSGVDLQPLHDA